LGRQALQVLGFPPLVQEFQQQELLLRVLQQQASLVWVQ
jgi:hypothetical protein